MRKLFRQNLGLIGFVAATLLARASLADHYVVPSGSMEPTVAVGDHVIVNKLACGLRVPLSNHYLFSRADPRPGDVVVLDSPVDDRVLLKRVVAGPGDTVQVTGGALERNGQATAIEERGKSIIENLEGVRHEVSLANHGGPDFGPVTLGSDQFLVMGDNRGNSYDGRSFGLVSGGSILGRGEGIYWRDSRLTWLNLR